MTKTQQIIKIELENPSTYPKNSVRMLQDADDKAVLLCMKEEYPIGTKALLMHSGLIKVFGIKTSDYGLTLKVSITRNGKRRRTRDVTRHEVMRSIIDMEQELIK